MIAPANPAALLVPDDDRTALDYEAADNRARLRIYMGLGLLALGFGLAGWAVVAEALVAAIALLVITAAGLIAIITGSTRRVDVGNRQRHDEVKGALAELSGRMITEFGDLHREIRIIEQRQTEFDHRQDKMDQRQDDAEVRLDRADVELGRLTRRVAELTAALVATPRPSPSPSSPEVERDEKWLNDVAEAYRLGQQVPKPPPPEPV